MTKEKSGTRLSRTFAVRYKTNDILVISDPCGSCFLNQLNFYFYSLRCNFPDLISYLDYMIQKSVYHKTDRYSLLYFSFLPVNSISILFFVFVKPWIPIQWPFKTIYVLYLSIFYCSFKISMIIYHTNLIALYDLSSIAP